MRNFFTNLSAPIDIMNNFLQAKFKPGFSDIGRFLLNTVAGAGFFDPAGKLGLERHEEDFGQTLAVWGVPSGGPLMLPILGMGTIRDWAGWTVDLQADVLWYNDSGAAWGLLLWRYTSDRAALLSSETALEGSFDEYALIRKAYLQRRRYQVYDGAPPDDDPSLDPSFDPAPDTPDEPSSNPQPEPAARARTVTTRRDPFGCLASRFVILARTLLSSRWTGESGGLCAARRRVTNDSPHGSAEAPSAADVIVAVRDVEFRSPRA